jgi:superfamily II DNA or RNA helicase
MKIEISNDLLLKEAPRGFCMAVMHRLTIKNPAMAEAERMGRWTGNIPEHIHGYTFTENGELSVPRGFGHQLHALAKEHGIQPLYEDHRHVLEPIAWDFKATLRPYQKQALEAISERDFGVLQAGCGAGKTVMALAVIASRQQPCLVLVHTRELADQWRGRSLQFLGVEPGLVGSGKFDVRPLTIGMVQTCKKHLADLVPRFGQLVVDEAHHCPSSTFQDVVSAFDCKFLLGLTATPFRRDGLGKLISWSLGDVVHKVDPAHLRKTGAILQPEIVPIKTSYQFWGDPSKQYSKMISDLTQNAERNRLIVSTVLREIKRQDGILLLLSDRTAHLEVLAAMLAEHGQEVAILTGSTPKKEREQIVCNLAEGKVKILASTMALLAEGFDCTGLSSLFLCSPVKFKGRLLQVAGRVMRPQECKQPRIIDFVDCEEPVLAASFKARQRVYREIAA